MIHDHRSHRSSRGTSVRPALSDLPGGTTGLVHSLNGGKDLSSRLAALGITPGAHITILQNFGHGPLTVAVRDTRLALGRGEACRVLVDVL